MVALLTYNAAMLLRALGSLVVAFALVGCQLVLGIEDPLPRGPTDPDDPRFGCEKWDALHFAPCNIVSPGGPLVLRDASYRYDTDRQELDDDRALVTHASEVVAIDGVEFVLISASEFELASGAELRVVGSRGLVIASWDGLIIDGVLDASSSLDDPGAGSRDDCTATAGTDAFRGSGGGGGAGYGGSGGMGGDGDNGDEVGGDGGDLLDPPEMPHGGCAGGDAGSVVGGVMPAAGGPGGGAIHLSARGDIQISGVVDVGGSGGGGGEFEGGGGGGGSGGCLSMDGAMIDIADPAILVSNGGAGGEGGDFDDPGDPGDSGMRSSDAAAGGRGNTPEGGNGGAGGVGDAPDGDQGLNGDFQDGGGGGGGSVGYIVARGGDFAISTNAIISPPLRMTAE